MALVFDSAIAALAHQFYDEAMEIAKDDQDLLTTDFEGFCRVMWPDDQQREAMNMTREDWQLAIQSAWEKLPR